MYVKELYLMLILDKDPKIAAKYLITAHVLSYIIDVQLTLIMINLDLDQETLARESSKVTPFKKFYRLARLTQIKNFILYGKENYDWIVSFYKELLEIYKNDISRVLSYPKPIFEFDNSFLKAPKRIPNKPLNFIKTHSTVKLDNSKIVYDTGDVIATNKMLYLMHNYTEKQFKKGYPDWYLNNISMYRSKDFLNQVKIRIDLSANGYKYYYSDELIEIENVPKEMEYLINSLLCLGKILPVIKENTKSTAEDSCQ